MQYGRLPLYFVLIFITEGSRGAVIPTSLHPRQGELQLTRNTGAPLFMTRNKREEPQLAILLPVPPETTEACNEDHGHDEESTEIKQLDTLNTDESNSVQQKPVWTADERPLLIHDTDSSLNNNDINTDSTQNGCKSQTVQTLIDQVQNNNRINLFQQLMNAEVLDNILILRNPFRKGCTKRCVKNKNAKDQNLRKDNKFLNIKKSTSNCKPIGKSSQSCKSKARHQSQCGTTENETTDLELELNKGEVENTGDITNEHTDKINYNNRPAFKDENQAEKKVTGLGKEKSSQISNNNGDTKNLQKPSESISGQWDVVETTKLKGEILTQENTIDYNEENTINHTVSQSGNEDRTQNTIKSHKEEVRPSSEKITENSNKSSDELLDKAIADNDIHKILKEKQQPLNTNTDVENAYNDFLNNFAPEPTLNMDQIEKLMNPKYNSQDENNQTLPGYNTEEFRDSAYSEETKKTNETDKNLIQKLVTETPLEKINNIKVHEINIKNQTTAGEENLVHDDLEKNLTGNPKSLSSYPHKNNSYNNYIQSEDSVSDMHSLEELTNKEYTKLNGSQEVYNVIPPNDDIIRDYSRDYSTESTLVTDNTLGLKTNTEAYTPELEKTDSLASIHDKLYVTNQHFTQSPDTHTGEEDSESTPIKYEHDSENPDSLNNIHYNRYETSQETNREEVYKIEPTKAYIPLPEESKSLGSTREKESQESTLSLDTDSKGEDSRSQPTKAYTPDSDTLASIHDNLFATSQNITHTPFTENRKKDSENEPTEKYTPNSKKPDSLVSTYAEEYSKNQETTLSPNTDNKMWTLASIHDNVYAIGQQASHSSGTDKGEEVYRSEPTTEYEPNPEKSDSVASTHENEYAKKQGATLSPSTDDSESEPTQVYTPTSEKSDTLTIIHNNKNVTSQEASLSTVREKDSESELTKAYEPDSQKPESLASTHDNEYVRSQEATVSPDTDSIDEDSGSGPTKVYEPDSENPDTLAGIRDTDNVTNQVVTLPPGTDSRVEDSRNYSTKKYSSDSEKLDTLDNEYAKSPETILSPGAGSKEDDSGSELIKEYIPGSVTPETVPSIHDNMSGTNQEAALSLGTDKGVEDSKLMASPKDNKITKEIISENKSVIDSSEEESGSEPKQAYTPNFEKTDTLPNTHENEYLKNQEITLSPDTDSRKEDSGNEPTQAHVPDAENPDTLASIHDNEYATSQKAEQSPDSDSMEEDYGNDLTKAYTNDLEKSYALANNNDNDNAGKQEVSLSPDRDSREEAYVSDPTIENESDSQKPDSLISHHENEQSQEATLFPDTDSREENSENKRTKASEPDSDTDNREEDSGNEPTRAYETASDKQDTLARIHDKVYEISREASDSSDMHNREGVYGSGTISEYEPNSEKPESLANIVENEDDKSQYAIESSDTDNQEEDNGTDPTIEYQPDSEKPDVLASNHANDNAKNQVVSLPSNTDSTEEAYVSDPTIENESDSQKPDSLISHHENEQSHKATLFPDTDSREEHSENKHTKASEPDSEKSDNVYATSQEASLSSSMDSREEAYGSDPTIENEPNSQKSDLLVNPHENKNVKSQEATLFPDTDNREEDSGNEPTRAYETASDKQDTLARIHGNVYEISREASDSSDMHNREGVYGSGTISEYEPNSEKPESLANIIENEYDKSQYAIESSDTDNQEEDNGTDPTIEYQPDSEKPDVLASNHDNDNAKNQVVSLPSNTDSTEEAYVSDPTIENESDSQKPDSLISHHENEQSHKATLIPAADSREENSGNERTEAYDPDSKKSDNVYATSQEASLSSSVDSREEAYGSEPTTEYEHYSEKTDSLGSTHENEYAKNQKAALYPGTDNSEEESGNEPTKIYTPTSEKSGTPTTIHNDKNATSQDVPMSPVREKDSGSEFTKVYEPDSEEADTLASTHENVKSQEATLSPDTDSREENSGNERTKAYKPGSEKSDNVYATSKETTLPPGTDSRVEDSRNYPMKKYSSDSGKPDTLGSKHDNGHAKSNETILSPVAVSKEDDSGSELTKEYIPGSVTPDTLPSIHDNMYGTNQQAALSLGADNTAEDSKLMASPKDIEITSENKSANQDINPNIKTQLTSPDDEKLIHITQNKTVLNTTNIQDTPLTRFLSWFNNSEPYNKGLQYFLGHHINGTKNTTRLPELKEMLSTNSFGGKDITQIPDNSFPDIAGLTAKNDKSKHGHFVGNVCIPKNQQNISLIELLTSHFHLEKNNSNIILKKKQKATNCSSDFESCQVFIKNDENENSIKNKKVLDNSTAKMKKDALVQSLANSDRENKKSQIVPPSNFNASILQNDTATDTTTVEMETISNTESKNSTMAENENKKINAKRQIIISMGKINNDIWHKRKRKDTEHSETETKKECLDTVLSALYHYYTAHNNTLGSAYLADLGKELSHENSLASTHSTEHETLSQNTEYSSTEQSHYFNDENSHYMNVKPASSQTEYSGDDHLYHSDEGNNSRYTNGKPTPPPKRNTSQNIKKNCTRKNMLLGQSSESHLGNTHEDEIVLPNDSLKIDRKLFEKFKTVYSANNKTYKENKQDDNLEEISHKDEDDMLGDHINFSTSSSEIKTLSEGQTNGCTSREPLRFTKYENYIGNRMDTIINILTSIRDFMVQN